MRQKKYEDFEIMGAFLDVKHPETLLENVAQHTTAHIRIYKIHNSYLCCTPASVDPNNYEPDHTWIEKNTIIYDNQKWIIWRMIQEDVAKRFVVGTPSA